MTTKPFPQLRRRSALKPTGRNASPELRRTYQAWNRLQNRYSARLQGLRKLPSRIDPRWVRSFDTFLKDVGHCPEGHGSFRPDPELPFGPGNFAWIPLGGPRGTGPRPKLYDLGGEQRSLREWAAHTGVLEMTLRSRLLRGNSLEQAIAPIDYRKKA
jgi:hypothetical protein